MLYMWINASGSSPVNGVNKRADFSTTSTVVGSFDSLGELALYIGRSPNWSDTGWWKLHSLDDGKSYCARNDVFKKVLLYDPSNEDDVLESQVLTGVKAIPHKTVLDIAFHSQNDSNSNLSPNDCGPASSTMMLERAGIHVTVNEFMQRAGITHTGFTSIADNIRALKLYGLEAVAVKPLHIADILVEIGFNKNPVFCLVYYTHLNPGKYYGHFLVAVGYELLNGKLSIIVHDPNRSAYMRFSVESFAKAIGYVGSSGNQPFQGIRVENYKTPITPPTIPAPPDTGGSADGQDYEGTVLRLLNTLVKQNEQIIQLLNK